MIKASNSTVPLEVERKKMKDYKESTPVMKPENFSQIRDLLVVDKYCDLFRFDFKFWGKYILNTQRVSKQI